MWLHPRLTPLGAEIGGSSSRWLAEIGPYGAWSDLQYVTRWGEGACGNFEASWAMPLPSGFEHPLLSRGTIVELMHQGIRVGSPFVMADPGRGSGLSDPWRITCTGVGREVEGESSYYAFDSSGDATNTPSEAVDEAIANKGLPWGGRDASVPTVWFGDVTPEGVQTIGALLTGAATHEGKRWLVDASNVLTFRADPTAPAYELTPGVAQLGTADDGYASTVIVRYLDAGAGAAAKSATATNAEVEARFGHREFLVDLTGNERGPITATQAQDYAAGLLANSKGRLAWTNSFTVTSNELLTMGGVPADLSLVAERVGTGVMVRVHGLWDDLLEFTGKTYIDVLIGEAVYADGSPTIELKPAGLAPRDMAAVVEAVTRMAAA